jgi:hypothetical protein
MKSNWVQQIPSQSAYWMNRVLFDVHHIPSHFDMYLRDPDAYLREIPLEDGQKAAIRDNDIGRMYLEGVNPYLLRAHCLGLRIPENVFLHALRAVKGGVRHG